MVYNKLYIFYNAIVYYSIYHTKYCLQHNAISNFYLVYIYICIYKYIYTFLYIYILSAV